MAMIPRQSSREIGDGGFVLKGAIAFFLPAAEIQDRKCR
jgi:hypothetical protein